MARRVRVSRGGGGEEMSLEKARFKEWFENLRQIGGRLRWFKAQIQSLNVI